MSYLRKSNERFELPCCDWSAVLVASLRPEFQVKLLQNISCLGTQFRVNIFPGIGNVCSQQLGRNQVQGIIALLQLLTKNRF